jgi:hypothetical protein
LERRAAPRSQSDVEAIVRPLAGAMCDHAVFLSGVISIAEPFPLGHCPDRAIGVCGSS